MFSSWTDPSIVGLAVAGSDWTILIVVDWIFYTHRNWFMTLGYCCVYCTVYTKVYLHTHHGILQYCLLQCYMTFVYYKGPKAVCCCWKSCIEPLWCCKYKNNHFTHWIYTWSIVKFWSFSLECVNCLWVNKIILMHGFCMGEEGLRPVMVHVILRMWLWHLWLGPGGRPIHHELSDQYCRCWKLDDCEACEVFLV